MSPSEVKPHQIIYECELYLNNHVESLVKVRLRFDVEKGGEKRHLKTLIFQTHHQNINAVYKKFLSGMINNCFPLHAALEVIYYHLPKYTQCTL